jgi:uncharacterized membrane protein YjjB (DUF3815 family)
VPGISAYTLDAFLAQANSLDVSRLESAVMELQDETQLARGLLVLAELRSRSNTLQ